MKRKVTKSIRSLGMTLSLLAFAIGGVFAQDPPSRISVRGVVSDEAGAPVVGVTIISPDGGAVTNALGEYSLTVASDAGLSFSLMGYQTATVPVGGRTTVDVTLLPDSQVLDDVIVIGYGTTTRRRATGAVDQIKASQIADRSVANVTQALQGTSPSLVIQNRSFNPNDQQNNINIRGIGTMNDNTPLLVVDGIPQGNMDALSQINPQDIASVSVLKDAGTAAIYGSRGANGVILINTKHGRRNQAPTVQFNAMVGVQSPKRLWEPVEGYQNAILRNVASANAGLPAEFTQEQIREHIRRGSGPILYDEIVKPAMQQSYNASVSGGSDNTTYLVSAGYFDQRSNYVGPGYGLRRYNFRTNIDTEYKRFKLAANLAYTRNNSLSTVADNGFLFADVARVPRYYYNVHTDPETGKYVINDVLNQYNTLGRLEKGGANHHDDDYISANAALDLKLFEGFKLRGVLGADLNASHRYTRTNLVEFYNLADMSAPPALEGTQRVSEDWSRKSWLVNMQVMADYDRTFGKHHVAAMVGASNESYQREEHQTRLEMSDPDLGIKGDGYLLHPNSYVSPENTQRTSISSLFGRFGYDYGDKYFVEASFRYDASSRFADVDRWGFFPSVSLSWRASEEGFMDWWRNNMGELKLRATYGTLGNQNISPYQYYTTWSLIKDTYGFDNTPVAGAGFSVASENLKWEVTRTLNFGVDASFLNNALTVSFDYFVRNTSDILTQPITPDMYGTSPRDANIGKMRTQGWELNMNYYLRTGEVNHSFNLNLGDSWNEVTDFNIYERLEKSAEYWLITRIGLPLKSYYGYKTDGLFQTQAEADAHAQFGGMKFQPGDPKYVDRDGNGVLDNNDLFYLGNPFPRYTFGFTYGTEWKGVDFSVFLQGVLKRDMMIRGELVEPFHGGPTGYGRAIYQHQLDYWTPTNTDAEYPRLAMSNFAYNGTYGSDILMYDASYMRVKNVQVGYTLPQRWTSKLGVSKFRLYANAQNLFTFSGISFVDPESSDAGSNMGGGGNSARNYPTLRYFGGGLDIVF